MGMQHEGLLMQETETKSQACEPRQSPPPVFLVGSERSGTTLLRLMLDHHPDVKFCQEFEFVVDAVRDGRIPTIQEYAEHLKTDRVFNCSGLTLNTDTDYVGACRDLLDQRLRASGKTYIGATVHRYYETLLKIWPDARFIYIQRDGRDVARSCIGMGWDGNIYTASTRWIESVHAWNALRDKLDPSRYIETSYEKIIADTRDELTKLCRFIGTEFHEDVWQYQDNSTYGEPDVKLIAQWKRKLSPRELGLVEGRIADLLTMQGYELSGHPPIKMTPLLRKRLWLQDRWARMTYRWKELGVCLAIGESLTKRTGPASLHRRILKKTHEIHNRTKR